MKIHDILRHFSSFTHVPIDPDNVAEQIRIAGVRDEIKFVKVSLDVRVLRGALHTYDRRPGLYAEPVKCSDIYFAADLSRAWQRLVCCKELLHLLDESVSKTATQGDFEALVTGLCNPNVSDHVLDTRSLQVWGDQLMVYSATALVFPLSVRELLAPQYQAGHITVQEIAALLDIPENVVDLVLTEQWPTYVTRLIGKA